MLSLEEFKEQREAQLKLNFKKEWERFAKAAEFKPDQEEQVLTIYELEIICQTMFNHGYYAAFEDAKFMATNQDLEE